MGKEEGLKQAAETLTTLAKLGVRVFIGQDNQLHISLGEQPTTYDYVVDVTKYVRQKRVIWVDRRRFLADFKDKVPEKALKIILNSKLLRIAWAALAGLPTSSTQEAAQAGEKNPPQ
jgi:uncharacterized protein (DUF1697 family)